MIELAASDGHRLSAYEVNPAEASAAVVIVQEIFGVNAHIQTVVDRYAGLGFHAIAPALFDRIERGVELEYTADGVAAGRDLRAGLDWGEAVLDVGAAVSHAAASGPVAVIGYCYGGSMAWLAANALPVAAAVGYYGGQVHQFIDRAPAAPTMLHFGGLDQMIPLADIEAVAARYPDVAVHVYDDADHGFNCDARPSYHEASAALALERTLDFLDDNGVSA
ncbi:MAG: dienelactone hydrolase family protein [Acidimicrobiia bacterium]|nr:dienelactone hydrolase family protein [Acidimicrobiia bacterium]